MDNKRPTVSNLAHEQNSLESVRPVTDNGFVNQYANQNGIYSTESLEVNDGSGRVTSRTDSNYTPPSIKLNFSKRRALVVSVVITLLVGLLSLNSFLFLIRKSDSDQKAQQIGNQQDVSLKDVDNSNLPPELQGADESLLVSGDLISRGSIKIVNNGVVTTLTSTNTTTNQTLTLPQTSGTFCLDSNNCNYASAAQLAGLQASVAQLAIPAVGVNTLNDQRGSVTVQGSLNQISVSTSGGIVTLSTPQNLDSNANVQFGNLTLSASGQITANKLVQTGAGNSIDINAGADSITFTANGRVYQLPASGLASQTICTVETGCAIGTGNAVLMGQTSAQTESTADATIFINDTAGGNLLQLQSSSANRLVVANNGDTTIGGSLTISALGNGFVRSTAGTLSVVSSVNLTSDVAGTLSVSNGGTGSASLLANGVLVGNGTSPVSSITAGGAGLCFISSAGAPSFQACPGGGVTSIDGQTGAVNLANASGSGGTVTVDDASTTTKGIAQFNNANFITSVGVVSIATGGITATELGVNAVTTTKIADGNVTNAKLANSSLTVTAGGGLVNGGSVALGGVTTLNIGQGDGITINADDVAVDATVCRTSGNCAGVGGTGDITGGGNINRLAAFSDSKNIVDSYLLQSAGTLTLDNGVDFVLAGGDINVTGGGSFSGTVSGANAVNNNEFVTLSQLNGAIGGVGGVTSIDGLSGVVTINNATGSGSAITIDDATTVAKGIASFSSSNFSVSSGSVSIATGGIGAAELATDAVTTNKIANGNVTNAKLQNDNITVTAGAGLTGGGATALGATATLNIGAGSGITVNANDIAVDATVARLNANANFTSQLQQGGNDVCTVAGNCAGVGGTGDVLQGGNNFGATMILGTTDTEDLVLITDGVTRLTISSAGVATFSGSVAAVSFSGDGANLTNLDADEITSGVIASARISGAYNGLTGSTALATVGTITAGIWNGTTITDAYIQDNITISSAGTVAWTALDSYPAACGPGEAITALGDMITCSPFGTGGSGVTTIGAIDSQTKSANGAVIVGSNLYLQTADDDDVGLVSTGSQTFAGAKTFNGSVTIAASQSLTVSGGTTGTRPASPTKGTLYFDTTTNQLLQWNGLKWVSDRSTATKIVAASSSSQEVKDAADYVADGTSDQVEINAALTAAGTGGTVYLAEGLYIVDGTILIPDSRTLAGASKNGTVVRLSVGSGSDNLIENSNTTSGVGIIIRDLWFDNVGATGGTQNGIYLHGMQVGNTNSQLTNLASSWSQGSAVVLDDVGVYRFTNNAILGNIVISATTTASHIQFFTDNVIGGTGNITITGGASSGNTIDIADLSRNNIFGNVAVTAATGYASIQDMTDNHIGGNLTFTGATASANANNVTGNTIIGNTTLTGSTSSYILNFAENWAGGATGLSINTGVIYTISDNTFPSHLSLTNTSAASKITNNLILKSSGVSGSSITLTNSDGNTILGNTIINFDGGGSGAAITLDAASANNYLADNNFASFAVTDSGTGTVYGGQTNSAGNFLIQPAGTIELMKNTNVTGILNITGNVDTNGSLTVGSADQFVISNAGIVTAGTWQGTAIADNFLQDNITVSSAGTVDWAALSNYPTACAAGSAVSTIGDTLTCTAFATGTSANYIQNQFASAQTTADFWISGNGRLEGNLQIGNGIPTVTLNGEDAYIEGTLEVDSSARFDGNVTIISNLTVTQAGNVAFQRNTTNYTATGTQDDINFGTGELFRITSASALTINGIAGGTDGRSITLMNASANTVTIANSASGTPANHIVTGTGSNLNILAGSSVQLRYDSSASVWRVVGSTAVAGGVANQQLSNLSGTIAINAHLTPDGDNTRDLGSGSFSWRSLYADTSVLAPTVDTATAVALNVGNTNASSISIGKTGSNIGITLSGTTVIKTTSGNDSATAFQVQNGAGNTIFGVDTSGAQALLGQASTITGKMVVYNSTNANTITIQSGTTSASYTLTLPTAVGATGDCLKASNGTGALGFAACTSGGTTRKITLVPEYPGGIISADGSNNNGNLTSDFDGTNVHNYYTWTSAQGALNDYDVIIRTALPSEYASGFGTFRIWTYGGSTSTANNNIQITVRDASGTACASSVSVLPGTAGLWVEQSVTIAGCTFAANDLIVISIKLSSQSNNAVRIGEISYQYTN